MSNTSQYSNNSNNLEEDDEDINNIPLADDDPQGRKFSDTFLVSIGSTCICFLFF
jgi:hypothetical protein